MITLLHRGPPSEAARRFVHLAGAVGIEARRADVRALSDSVPAASDDAVFALDISDSAAGAGADDWASAVARLPTDRPLLVLCTVASTECGGLVRDLTGGAIRGIAPHPGSDTIEFPAGAAALSRELAGSSHPRTPGGALVLQVVCVGAVTTIMTIGGESSFVRTDTANRHVYVWASPTVFDMHRPMAAELAFEEALDQFIPGIVFLRAAFGERCWTNPQAFAGIVIDDPLLRPRYGHLAFEALLESARTGDYNVTLGYIPWNHWRVRSADARMFRESHRHFSLCAHGCDHTRREFDSADGPDLLDRSIEAARRMDAISSRHGLAYVPVMVCPQERYSLQALAALSASGRYLGLVNASVVPKDVSEANGICGADLLWPAQDRYWGFPIFKRHYAKNASSFALSLFLGKPAILAAHHDFFGDGLAGVESIVHGLRQLRPDIKWPSLATVARSTHCYRLVDRGRYEVRLFADAATLLPPRQNADADAEYEFVRRLDPRAQVRSVSIGEASIPFSFDEGYLRFCAPSGMRGLIEVNVERTPQQGVRRSWRGVAYHSGVAIRRVLSEFRDSRLTRSERALAAAQRLARALKQSSVGASLPLVADLVVSDLL